MVHLGLGNIGIQAKESLKMAASRKLRLWPLWVLLILDLAMVLWIWRGEIDQRQSRLMATIGLQVAVVFLAGLHFLFFARLSGKARIKLLLAGFAFAVLAFFTIEIREVSGDVVPLLSWKWSAPPEERLNNENQSAVAILEAGENQPHYLRFLGPQGNAILSGPPLATSWDTNPPTEVWRIEIGSGWSSFSVIGNLVFTMEQRGDKEMTTCYNLQNGNLIWAQGDESRYASTIGGNGPRSTPTIDHDKVFTMGAKGHLSARELTTGNLLWHKDLQGEFGAKIPEWGFAASPLATDTAVIINASGSDGRMVLAFDKASGELLWQAGNDHTGYSSPQLRNVAGLEAVILLNDESVTFHRPSDGFELLSMPWPKGRPNVANPLLLPGDKLLVSSGYGVGAVMWQMEAVGENLKATQIWKNLRLKAKFANYVYLDDYVYGLDDGILACVAIADGKRAWKGGRYGHGQVLLVGDKLLVQSEKGTLHLVEANPQERVELGSIKVLNGKAWNTMALAGDLLLMRNHKEAVCLKLPTLSNAASLN